jgi:hypothetical protein
VKSCIRVLPVFPIRTSGAEKGRAIMSKYSQHSKNELLLLEDDELPDVLALPEIRQVVSHAPGGVMGQ